jgi:ABC-2 type transport system permease protein
MNDIATLVWKEWKENIIQGGVKSVFTLVVSVGIFGVFLPLMFGPTLVESPTTILLWSWFPLFYIVQIITDAFAGERERHTLETLLASRLSDKTILLGKTLASALYGYLMMIACAITGLLTTSLVVMKENIPVSPVLAAGFLTISFLVSWLTAIIGVQSSIRSTTVKQSQQVLLTVILVIVFGGFYGVRLLPDELISGMITWLLSFTFTEIIIIINVALLVVNTVATVLSVRNFRRNESLF